MTRRCKFYSNEVLRVMYGPALRGHRFYIAKTCKNLFMNNWPECIDICYGASLGPGDSSCSIEVLVVTNGHIIIRGHIVFLGKYSKYL